MVNMYKLVVLCVLGVTHAQNVQVNTTEGIVEGARATDGNYFAFYGLRYAGPTDGENRFKAPVPPSPYPGLFHATDTNIICAQPGPRGVIGVENCLTLDIFTRNVSSNAANLKPVLVWLNAEEYTTSLKSFNSYKTFVEEGVPEAPGNAGIKDVIQGLKWIKKNIANFGGNPDNIILMGHGSGAAIVDIITMSPLSVNLVHKAVALSGSALAPWAVAYDPIGYAKKLGEKLSYTEKSASQLAKLLVSTDISLFASSLNDFKFYNNTPLFAPCIENVNLHNPNDTVLTDAPINLLTNGSFNHIPYIAGYVNREGTMRAEEAAFGQWLEKMQANFTDFLQVDLDFGANRTREAESIKNFYFSGMPINMATIEDYLDYQGDTLVLVSVIRGARERAATSKADVRLLEFAYMGTMNSDWNYNQIPLSGVKHGAILNYLFDFDLKESDLTVKQSIVQRLSTFASTGVPTPQNLTEWEAITPETLFYFYYGGSPVPMPNANLVFEESTRFNPHTTRMTIWNQLYYNYYRAPKPVSSATKLADLLYIVMFGLIFVRVL